MHGLDDWTLEAWMLGLGDLVAWTLDAWTLDHGPRKFYPFLVASISLLLLCTVDFLGISNALCLMCYGSAKTALNSCYNLNLLDLIF